MFAGAIMVYRDDFDEKKVSRRGFIRGAAVTALGIGAGAVGHTVLEGESTATTITSAPISPPVTAPVTLPNVATTNDADLVAQIANLSAENLRLQTALTSSQQQLDSLQQINTSDATVTEALTLELESANQQIGVLAGLVGLYEQLDTVELDKMVDKGVTAVSTTLGNLLAELPALEEGVQIGQVALDDFEAQLPLLQNGRIWLRHHIDQLRTRFTAVEFIFQETVERVEPLFDLIQMWVTSINKWLPFNMGQRALQIMETVADLVLETPNTLSGVATNVAEPLDLLLSDGEGEHPVQANLIRPMRERLIAHTHTAVTNTRQLTTTFADEMETPLKTAVEQQRQLRGLITQYRHQHNV